MRTEILFIHGRYGDGSCFDSLAEQLNAHVRCRTLELPGFGRSFCMDEREMSLHDLVQLVAEVTRNEVQMHPEARWILVGHDIGALVAELAAIELSRADKPIFMDLVLLSPTSLHDIPAVTGKFGTWMTRLKLRRLISEVIKNKPVLKEAFRGQLRPPTPAVLHRLAESWPGPLERTSWNRLRREFEGSLLLLWGAQDLLNKPESLQEILNVYRNVEFFRHEEAGHWLFVEDPIWVSEKVKTFLFRTTRRYAKTG